MPKLPHNDHDHMIRRVALNYLTRRDHGQHELLQKLKTKKYPVDDILAVIDELLHSGLLNDQRFIANYIDNRRRKGYGPKRIYAELEAKGLSTEMIAEQLKITDNIWQNEAYRIWQKHFKSQQPKDFKSKLKQMRFLQYRGFTREQIESVLQIIEVLSFE